MSGKWNKQKRRLDKLFNRDYIVCPECGALIECCEENEAEIIRIMKGEDEKWLKGLWQN